MSENNHSRKDREEIFSQRVKAGKRTYFFDVKTTRTNDFYLTITESKKRFGDDGSPFYEKHKIFLLREDFDKFLDGFNECVNRVSELRANAPESPAQDESRTSPDDSRKDDKAGSSFSDVSFEDLK
jgi:hypothetical protein